MNNKYPPKVAWISINTIASIVALVVILFTSTSDKVHAETINSTKSTLDKKHAHNANKPVDIYVGGYKDTMDAGERSGYFKNGSWYPFKLPKGSKFAKTTKIKVSKGNVYAAGTVYIGVKDALPGYWKNQEWHPLPLLKGSRDGYAYAFDVLDDDIYAAGGMFIDGVYRYGVWKNGKWQPLKSISRAEFKTLVVVDDDIYIGGENVISSNLSELGYWKNGKWNSLQIPKGKRGEIKALIIDKGAIYIAGILESPGKQEAVYWKNGTLNILELDKSKYSVLTSFTIEGEDIYAGGWGNIYNPGYWKNGKWNNLPWINRKFFSGVNALTIVNSTIYAAGANSEGKDYKNYPGYWENGKWKNSNTLTATRMFISHQSLLWRGTRKDTTTRFIYALWRE